MFSALLISSVSESASREQWSLSSWFKTYRSDRESARSLPRFVISFYPAFLRWKFIQRIRIFSAESFTRSESSSPSLARRMISGTSFNATDLVEISLQTYQITPNTRWGIFSRKESAPIPISLTIPEQAASAKLKFSRIL